MTEIKTVARPPREWEAQTIALMAAIAGAALLAILLLVTDLAVRSYLLDEGANGVSSLVVWVVHNGEALSLLFLLVGFAYLAGFSFWRRRTRAMLDSVGDTDPHGIWHWTVGGFYIGLAASIAIRFGLRQSGETYAPETMLIWDATQIAAKLIGLTFLLIAVWQIRFQVRSRVARAGIALRIADLPPRRSAVPLAALSVPATPARGDLPPADDQWWQQVAALATGMRAPIALLETTEGVAHRWLLVPENGDLDAVRSAVAGGAVVTAFPEPPDASSTKDFTPRAADSYHGLLEDSETGALWHQLVRPNRVGAFLARAGRARRWALYPADGSAALTAVVP